MDNLREEIGNIQKSFATTKEQGDKLYELIEDTGIGFAKFLDDIKLRKDDFVPYKKYSNIPKSASSQELFTYFINNIYKPK